MSHSGLVQWHPQVGLHVKAQQRHQRLLLQDICCSSQHTYAHAQQLLQELGSQPQGGRFKRLSQDMEVYAAEKLGHPIAWKMHQ